MVFVKHMTLSRKTILMFLFISMILPAAASAEGTLGIALKQGYDYPYISAIDPYVSAAASGLMQGDHIKDIGAISVWFVDQGRRFFKYFVKKGQPFMVVITRDGVTHRLQIDMNKPPLEWPARSGSDAYSTCYFSPNAACVEAFITEPNDEKVSVRFNSYDNAIRKLMQLGQADKARAYYEEMEALFFNTPELIQYYSSTLFRIMHDMGITPDQRHFDYVYKHIDKTKIYDLLEHASLFSEFGAPEFGAVFLNAAMALVAKKPKTLESNTRGFGKALAALKNHDALRSYLTSSDHSSETKNKLLSEVIWSYMKQSEIKLAEDALLMIDAVPRKWTDKDHLIFIRLFIKMHKNEAAWTMVERVIKHYEESKGKMFAQPILAATLVKAYGAYGSIHKGRQLVNQHFSKDPLWIMMELAIEAADSKSSHWSAVQFYKDFPKLLDDTYALLKATPLAQRQKLNKSTLKKFYVVLAAYKSVNPSIKELDGLGFDKYSYGSIIDAFIEARKLDTALRWTDEVEGRFGKTYKYSAIFTALGSAATSSAEIERFARHPKFNDNKYGFGRTYLDMLYRHGQFDQALSLFNQKTPVQKRSTIMRQIGLFTPCRSCDL